MAQKKKVKPPQATKAKPVTIKKAPSVDFMKKENKALKEENKVLIEKLANKIVDSNDVVKEEFQFSKSYVCDDVTWGAMGSGVVILTDRPYKENTITLTFKNGVPHPFRKGVVYTIKA